jgi:hypothetical protein
LIRINDKKKRFKIYDTNTEALVLDLSLKNRDKSVVHDSSGFDNHGRIVKMKPRDSDPGQPVRLGKDCFIDIPGSESLENFGSSITMMAWVYPIGFGSADLLTKGDHHVFQVVGNKSLNFFAGGWGRGECSINLPSDWTKHWHHITGVCDGNSLNVYIDGVLKGVTKLDSAVDLVGSSNWNIGRNAEFPGERIFNGYMDKVKIFSAPLSHEEIMVIVKKEDYIANKINQYDLK